METQDSSSGTRVRLQALLAHRAALLVVWPVFFLVYGQLRLSAGESARVLLLAAVLATAWYHGPRIGALAGFVAVPIGALMYELLTGGSLAVARWFTADVTAGTLASILGGGVVGYMRELNQRLTAEAVDRRRAEDDLRSRDERLAIVNGLARAVKGGASGSAVIKAAVQALHSDLPKYRTAYSTLDGTGRITIVHALGPADLSWPDDAETDLTLPLDCLDILRTGEPIIINDVDHDVDAGGLSAALGGGNVRACLDVPVTRPDSGIGLLSLDAPTPHAWTDHERAMVGEVADFLGVALNDAHAKQRLAESEQRFRKLADSSHAVIALMQKDGAIYLNPELERLSEYSHDELMQMTLWDLLHPDDRDMIRKYRGRRLQGEEAPIRYETRIVTKSGATRWLDVRASTFELAGEQTILTTGVDITDRKKSEQALRDSEARLRVLLDHYFDGIAVVENAEIVYVNPSLCRMLGRTAPDLIGSAGRTLVDDHIVAHHRDRALRRMRELLNGAPEYPSEYEGRRSDGSAIPLEVTTRAIQFDGKPALLTTLRDLTARHEAEARIRESEQRFRSLFEQAPIGIVLADADTRLIRVNQAFCEMLGYTESELCGRSFVEISHPDDAGGTPDSARKVLSDAASVLRLQKRYLRKDGGTIDAETTVSLTRDPAGQLLYAVAMVEDITEKSRLEEQLRQSQRLESVGQLAGGVAHNFNNALTAIIGYSELLGRRFDGHDAGLKDVEQIQRVAEQAATLTRQLLTFSRKELVRPSVFCLNAAVETTSALLSPLIGDQIRLRLTLDRNLRNVRADRSQIEQVITNLVFNARDALREGGGALSIETADVAVDGAQARLHPDARPGAYVRLSVSDTGTGIEPTALPRIFEPFFTTKDQGEGVGLGLAMVHGAIKQSGGYVMVRSEPGQGATFELYLPVHAEPADSIEPAVEQSAAG